MNHIRQHIPTGNRLEVSVDLVDYFDNTYVTRSIRRFQRPVASHLIQPLRIHRTPPLFPPSLWNVHYVTLGGADRTNSRQPSCTAALQASSDIIIRRCGHLLKLSSKMKHWWVVTTVKRVTQQLQSRLLSLCVARRDNKKTSVEVLEGLWTDTVLHRYLFDINFCLICFYIYIYIYIYRPWQAEAHIIHLTKKNYYTVGWLVEPMQQPQPIANGAAVPIKSAVRRPTGVCGLVVSDVSPWPWTIILLRPIMEYPLGILRTSS